MKIALVQFDIAWENVAGNLAAIEAQLKQVSKDTDVVVLPEMFTTGFTMNPEKYAHRNPDEVLQHMKKWSAIGNYLIVGSIPLEEGGKFYNRLYWVKPSGEVGSYNKRHLFRMAGEDQHYAAGEEKCIVSWRNVTFSFQICYDLRFPVWSRNTEQADVLVYVANWPAVRISAWDKLLAARAIENLCYTVGVNRVGTDANGIEHNGHSMAYDFIGNPMGTFLEGQGVLEYQIDTPALTAFRQKFPAHLDADQFDIRIE